MPTQTFYFVKTLIRLAFDRQDREREMASSLLSVLYGEVLPHPVRKTDYFTQNSCLRARPVHQVQQLSVLLGRPAPGG